LTSKSNKPAPESEPLARTEPTKRAYEKPRLTDYGPVNKLTQTGGLSVVDNRTMFRPCL
jgi:hypothetical protein